MAIDIEARRQLSQAIRQYLNDEISAFQLDDAVGSLRTDDFTAVLIRKNLWYFYDDLKDHKVVLTRLSWDSLQRQLLVLDSGAEIARRWRIFYPWENIGFLGLLAAMVCFPWIIATIRSGLPAWLGWGALRIATVWLHLRKKERLRNRLQRTMVLTPFTSVRQLLSARRACRSFAKQAWREEIAGRHVRHWILELDATAAACVLLAFIAPLLAAWQLLPTVVEDFEVVSV